MTKGCAGVCVCVRVCVCVCVQSLTLVAGVNISVPEEQVMGLGVCLGGVPRGEPSMRKTA